MSEQKLTKWFRCDKRQPNISGWYDIAYDENDKHNPAVGRYYWSGTKWVNYPNDTHETLFGNCLKKGDKDSWRGLTSPSL